MRSLFGSLLLLGPLALSAAAQTTTAHRPVHRTTPATAPATPTANPADNPPNVPAVVGTPKPLYALRYVDTVIGTGPLAEPQKYYTVRYTGWLTTGAKFDSSDDHPGKDPITFPYGAHQVIPGWDTGFQSMHVGGKRRLYIPYQLAYGEAGRPPVIPAKSDLIFDIELVSISDTPPPPPEAPPTSAPAALPEPAPVKLPDTSVPPAPGSTTAPATPPSTPPKPETPQHP